MLIHQIHLDISLLQNSGPAKAWKDVIWRGSSLETPSDDNPIVDVIGIDANNVETTLYSLDLNTQNLDVSTECLAVPVHEASYEEYGLNATNPLPA